MPWPIGTLPIVEPDQYDGSRPGALAREVDARLLAEAELLDPLLQARLAEQRARDRHRADVRRALEDLRDRHRLRPARLGVVDAPVGDLDRVRQRERRLRRDELLGQRAGDRHDLEHRARLEDVADRVVALQRAAPSGTCSRRSAGASAIASTAPVFGSSTIAVALFAPHFATVWRSTCSAFAWIVWSSVRNDRLARPRGRDVCSIVDRAAERVADDRLLAGRAA